MRRMLWTAVSLSLATTACNIDLGPLGDKLPQVDFDVLNDSGIHLPDPHQDHGHPVDKVVIVPRHSRLSGAEASLVNGSTHSGHRVVYLNRHGGTYTPGWDNNSSTNESTIVPWNASIPAYKGGDWANLLSCVQQQFEPFNITITDRDPGDVPHIEAVIGGHPSHIGESDGVGGIAPMYGDCGTVERAVTFVFEDVFWSTQGLCEVTAHEIGHALGLEHLYLCEDPMTYLDGCGEKTFQDQHAQCGTWSPEPCDCGPTQNSYQFLMGRLGPSSGGGQPTPPVWEPDDDPQLPPVGGGSTTVSVLKPVVGQPNTTGYFEVEARVTGALSELVLYWYNEGWSAISCFDPPPGVSCERSGEIYTWGFEVGWGTRTMLVEATNVNGQVETSVTYTLYFRDGGPSTTPPPIAGGDDTVVTLNSPRDGSSHEAGDVMEVRAHVDGATHGDEVWLWWFVPGGDVIPVMLYELGGGDYGVDLLLGEEDWGDRSMIIEHYAGDGSVVASDEVWVEIW